MSSELPEDLTINRGNFYRKT